MLAVVVEMVQQEVMRSRERRNVREDEVDGREVLFVRESQVIRGGRSWMRVKRFP